MQHSAFPEAVVPQCSRVMCTWLHGGLPAGAPAVFFSPAGQKDKVFSEGLTTHRALLEDEDQSHLVFFKLLIFWIVGR